MKKFYALLLGVLCSTAFIFSQVPGSPPQGFSYKATIIKANGAIVIGKTISFRISIIQGSSNGIPVHTEVFYPKTNEYGQIDIIIGSTGLSYIQWDQGPFFLKTEFDEKGGTNFITMSIAQLLSVPYALYSGSSSATNETDPIFKAHDAYLYSSSLLDRGNTAYSWGNHAGLYRSYSWVPTWSEISGKPSLATVATSGSYNDLLNIPTLYDGNWASLSGKPTTIDGYGITDAISTAHIANGITSEMMSNWNNSFAWGNHATAGYLTGGRTLTINGTSLDLSDNRSWSVGTVTSVGLSMPSLFSVSGSPITSTGTFSAALAPQSANFVLASPDGSDGIPTFRKMTAADIPNLDWSKITTGKPTTLAGYGITDGVNSNDAATKAYVEALESRIAALENLIYSSSDRDGDGYSVNQNDCNDQDPTIYPHAPDICGDGIDQDCQGGDTPCAYAPACLPTPVDPISNMTNIINTYRLGFGFEPLAPDPRLSQAAQSHADYLASIQTASHIGADGSTFTERCQNAGYTLPSGEVVSWGFTFTETMDYWMVSPHKEIIYGNHRHFGIGISGNAYVIDFGVEPGGPSCIEDNDQDGYFNYNNDCNDNDPSIHPGATEICDNKDNNCDGNIDEGCSMDKDGDGLTVSQGDCNDNDSAIHPGAVDLCDGIDNDCNGSIDDGSSCPEGYYCQFGSCVKIDLDGDGYGPSEGDCDDNDPAVHPGATEICGDGIDQDCDGVVDDGCPADADLDGYSATNDCDDSNAAIHPGATEICGDNIDQDCDGVVDDGCPADADMDGYSTTNDCDDSNSAIHPGATEICGDNIDQDCDGVVDENCTDQDGDGIIDAVDNCPIVSNPDQADSDGDGIGNVCELWGNLNTNGLSLTSQDILSSQSSFKDLSFTCENNFNPAFLNSSAQEIYYGASGSGSATSKALCMEILNRFAGASLLRFGSSIAYINPAGKKLDIIVTIDGQNVGTTVTRAYNFTTNVFTVPEAISLLNSKLVDINLAETNLSSLNPIVNSILVVFAYDAQAEGSIISAWNTIDMGIKGNTILLIVRTDGNDNFIYN